jgi:hypothetical protein
MRLVLLISDMLQLSSAGFVVAWSADSVLQVIATEHISSCSPRNVFKDDSVLCGAKVD